MCLVEKVSNITSFANLHLLFELSSFITHFHCVTFSCDRFPQQLSMKVATDRNIDDMKIGNLEWLENLTSRVTKQMLTHCGSTYKQRHLLSLLARAMFGRNFSRQGL